jgi:predicted transposase/invertase (TIGR01784 family)
MAQNLNPKIDFVFRKLFGVEENKDILIALINSVVEPDMRLTDVTIKNPFNLASYLDEKESVLDIKAVDQNGLWYDIETQITARGLYGKRAIYYLSKIYTEQLGKGRDYSKLNTAIGIHFLDFTFFEDDDRIIRQFIFKDVETNEAPEALRCLRLYFVEMGKFHKDWPEVRTALDRWIAFLNKAQRLSRKRLPAPLKADAAIVKAIAELERFTLGPEERDIYEKEVEQVMLEEYDLKEAEGRGERRGERRGMQQGMQHVLIRHMTRRIGDVPGEIATRLNTLGPNELDDLDAALFNFTSYTDVEKWLTRH